MKIRWIAALLAVLLLTACGAKESGTAGSSAQTSSRAAESTAAPAETPRGTDPTQQPESSAVVTTAPAATEPLPEPEVRRGRVEGEVYSNEFLGLRYALPEGHEFYDEAELASINGVSPASGVMSDRDMDQCLRQGRRFIEMLTRDDPEPRYYAELMIEDLGGDPSDGSVREYFEKELGQALPAFAEFGYHDTELRYETFVLDGRECESAVITTWLEDQQIFERLIGFVRDHYIVLAMVCGHEAEKTDALCEGFAWME